MLNPIERQALIDMQNEGIELTPEDNTALMQADEPQDVPEGKECEK